MIWALQSLVIRGFGADKHTSMGADIGNTMGSTVFLCEQHWLIQGIIDGHSGRELASMRSKVPVSTKR